MEFEDKIRGNWYRIVHKTSSNFYIKYDCMSAFYIKFLKIATLNTNPYNIWEPDVKQFLVSYVIRIEECTEKEIKILRNLELSDTYNI